MSACTDCLRRSWLLARLSACLSYRARDRERLLALLALADEELIQAIAGRRRVELRERWASFEQKELPFGEGSRTICCHRPGYPRGLKLAAERGPRMLHLAGSLAAIDQLDTRPIVAIVGSRKATDYGMEMARSLARGLTASGVTVAGSLADGIAVAAQMGALEAGAEPLTVIDGGLDVACTARTRVLFRRLRATGCVVAELPGGCGARSWGQIACERTVVGLAALTIVVEADENPRDLFAASVAGTLGRAVAAIPGRVTSPVSRGTHALILAGAALVRGPSDVLDLLCEGHARQDRNGIRPTIEPAPSPPKLERRLQQILEQVGAGNDTLARLTAGRPDVGEVPLALSELELMGLLTRGDGGRYLPRESLAASKESFTASRESFRASSDARLLE